MNDDKKLIVNLDQGEILLKALSDIFEDLVQAAPDLHQNSLTCGDRPAVFTVDLAEFTRTRSFKSVPGMVAYAWDGSEYQMMCSGLSPEKEQRLFGRIKFHYIRYEFERVGIANGFELEIFNISPDSYAITVVGAANPNANTLQISSDYSILDIFDV